MVPFWILIKHKIMG